MRRFAVLLMVALLGLACGQADTTTVPEATPAPDGPSLPPILERSIEFHGGPLYDRSIISVTITSLSGTFDIVARRAGGEFDYTVTGAAGPDQAERRVRLTNDTVEEWRSGAPVPLDEEGTTRARNYVNARVFFPLLPYTLKGGDIRFEDRGIQAWEDRRLHEVKVTFAPGTSSDASDSYRFWFDPETGRMEQFAYDFSGGLRFRKAIRFHDVDGVTFSDQENYAIDGDRIPVDTLTPDYLAQNMKLLSTVALTDIEVEPL